MSHLTWARNRAQRFFRLSQYLVLILGVFCSTAEAREQTAKTKPDDLKWKVYRLDGALFYSRSFGGKHTVDQYQDGVGPVQSTDSKLLDVKNYLTMSGVSWPPEGVAIFSKPDTLIIRGTQKNIDLIDTIFDSVLWHDLSDGLQVSVTLVEYSLPADRRWNDPSPLAYSELEKMAAGSIKVLDQTTGVTTSGQKLFTEHVTSKGGSPGRNAAVIPELKPLVDGQTGIQLALEPTIEVNGKFIEVQGLIHYRVGPRSEAGEPGVEMAGDATLSKLVWNGSPIVVQSSRLPDATGKSARFLAVILRIDFTNPAGRARPTALPLPSAKSSGQ